jgi:CheY-like chemotaxis protein
MPVGDPHLPHVRAPEQSVGIDAIGRALRTLYDDLVAEGVPEHLAELVHRFDDRVDQPAGEKQLAIIVEDDPELRDLARAILEETSLGVVTCATAEAALGTLQARGGSVTFMFIDVRLAGMMDGIDLAQAVSKLWPQVRIILTSGAPDESLKPLPPGAVFVPKPWRALTLLVEADRALEQPQPVVL